MDGNKIDKIILGLPLKERKKILKKWKNNQKNLIKDRQEIMERMIKWLGKSIKKKKKKKVKKKKEKK